MTFYITNRISTKTNLRSRLPLKSTKSYWLAMRRVFGILAVGGCLGGTFNLWAEESAPALTLPLNDTAAITDPLLTHPDIFAPLLTPPTAVEAIQVLGEKILSPSELTAVYSQPDAPLIWFGQTPTSAATTPDALVQFIAQINTEGLLPEDYHYGMLRDRCGSNRLPAEVPACDLLLSDAFLTLAHHLARGKINPLSINAEWKTKIAQIDTQAYLHAVKGGANPVAILTGLRPQALEYAALLAELKTMRERSSSAPAWPPMEIVPSIKENMDDSRLPAMVERLKFWGDLRLDYNFTGTYDSDLQAAVRHFQQRHGLDGDGVSGKSTFLTLNASPAYRVQQLIANLERWRWLPVDLGHKHIIVNIPSFELKGVIDNQVVLRKPVIVGRNYRRTPIFSSRINQLIFNPTWTVPPKLAVEDKLPEIRRDPNFFNKLGIVVYERDRVVTVNSVNWSRLNKNNFPFRLVQQPGPQNALGVVKFLLPNNDDIYLHDTPSRHLFSRAERAFSSGCVRVHKPLELALWLLKDQNWDMTRIDTEVAKGLTEPVQLAKPVPVHLEYWTAILDDSGAVVFRSDLYDRDLPLWQALTTPLVPAPAQ